MSVSLVKSSDFRSFLIESRFDSTIDDLIADIADMDAMTSEASEYDAHAEEHSASTFDAFLDAALLLATRPVLSKFDGGMMLERHLDGLILAV